MIAPGFARARFTPALTPALANTTVLPAAWRAVGIVRENRVELERNLS